MHFDNDSYEARMTYIRNLYNLTPQKSDDSVCRQSDSLTVFDPIIRQNEDEISQRFAGENVMMAMVNLHIILSSCDGEIQ